MEALHELISVLCNPEGKVCISGSPADLEIIQKSLDTLRAENARLVEELANAKANIDDLCVNMNAVMDENDAQAEQIKRLNQALGGYKP